MSKIILKLQEVMINITYIFEGDLGHFNKEIIEMKREVLYEKIPSPSMDKRNLRGDTRLVAKDLKVSLDDYKKSHQLAIAE